MPEPYEVEIYEDEAGEWRWRLKAGNNRIVADSGEGYTREHDAREAVVDVIANIRRGELPIK